MAGIPLEIGVNLGQIIYTCGCRNVRLHFLQFSTELLCDFRWSNECFVILKYLNIFPTETHSLNTLISGKPPVARVLLNCFFKCARFVLVIKYQLYTVPATALGPRTICYQYLQSLVGSPYLLGMTHFHRPAHCLPSWSCLCPLPVPKTFMPGLYASLYARALA